jgi:hypothetical protein
VTSTIDNGIETPALNEVAVWHNNEVINYDFSYSNASKRLKTLSSITKTNGNDELPFYDFEYHPFPYSINYKQQDLWGYYNGKPNSSLINGDREVVFDKTRSGALKKIIYPTKGSTEIIYEQNRVVNYTSNPNASCTYSHNATPINDDLIGNSNPQYLDIIVNVPPDQIVKVYAYARVGNGSAGNMFGAEASIEVKTFGNVCNYGSININKYVNGEDVPCGSNCTNDMYTDGVTQYGYTQDGKIHIKAYVEAPQGKLAKIYYKIDYEDSINNNNDKLIGGIRVAQTKDCHATNDCIITDYEYINTDNTSSGNLLGPNAVFYYSKFYHINDDAGNKYYFSTSSMQNFNSYQNAPVLYDRVEIVKNGGGYGKTVKYYSKFGNQGFENLPFMELENNDWRNGRLIKTEFFKEEANQTFTLQKVKETLYDEYYPYGSGSSSTSRGYNFDVARIKYFSGDINGVAGSGFVLNESEYNFRERHTIDFPKDYKPTQTTSRTYFSGQELLSETFYDYSIPSLLLKEKRTDTHDEVSYITKTYYPEDVAVVSDLGFDTLSTDELNAIKKLQSASPANINGQNRIATAIQTETYKDQNENDIADPSELISVQRTNFKDWGSNMVLPIDIQTLQGNYNSVSNTLRDRIVFHDYYDDGRIKEVSKKDGTHIVYIWGYNKTLPVAKVENATYSEVATYISNIQNKSNLDNDRTIGANGNEGDLRSALNSLRNALQNAMVTTYTYDSLIGVTSVTDAMGYTTYYHYDEFNRLEYVKDDDGNITSKTKYHFKD